jgi:hypothetical protein
LAGLLGEVEEAAERPGGGTIGETHQRSAQRLHGATVLKRETRRDGKIVSNHGDRCVWLFPAIKENFGKPAVSEA